MTEPSKKKQRARAERRRKLEEFWRWACEEKVDTGLIEQKQLNLPALCREACDMVAGCMLERDGWMRPDWGLHRDLSLAQLEVLEMLEERVGEREEPSIGTEAGMSESLKQWVPIGPPDTFKSVPRTDLRALKEPEKRRAFDPWARRMMDLGLDDVGEQTFVGQMHREGGSQGKVVVLQNNGSNVVKLVTENKVEIPRFEYDPRKDPFFHPEVEEDKLEFKCDSWRHYGGPLPTHGPLCESVYPEQENEKLSAEATRKKLGWEPVSDADRAENLAHNLGEKPHPWKLDG